MPQVKEETFNNYHITEEQKEAICLHFNEDVNVLEHWEVCELLDRLIDTIQ